ncbi:glycoside hydrolase family 3 N-terminal domain-containing protein [Flexivirga aerilata]|uniref:glycoside hydrolase family 3 N-terminal domain-containing protein n=1 Tax=Flexivirga aerilata TaxID=1656889 RepID=UPI001BB1D62B
MIDPAVDRLVHRVLKPGFAGRSAPPAWLSRAVETGLGGVVYFSHNIGDVEQTAALSAQLHAAGEVLIATDEEGGIVSRLGARGGSPHVGAAALGRADDPGLTRRVAAAIGHDLAASGIDIDLAPVVDVNSNPANPVIGVRSFGATAELVSRHGVAYVEGLQHTGIAATAKHFPGHGDTAVDSHVGLPHVDAPMEVLRERELAPFAAVVRAGVQAVMTAHVIIGAVDPDRPATISPAALRMLRDELGFDGVIMSDALDMSAIRDTIGLGEGCVQALLAGADLLGLGNPVLGADHPGSDERVFAEARGALVDAAMQGRLPVGRLEEAADRVDRLWQWCGSHGPGRPGGQGDARADANADAEADRIAAARSLAVRGAMALPGRPLQIVDLRRQRNVASGALTASVVTALVHARPGSVVTSAFTSGGGGEGQAGDDRLLAHADLPVADVLVVGAPARDATERDQLRAALQRNPAALVVALGYVTDDEELEGATHVIRTFGDSVPTGQAVAQLVSGD